MYVREYKADGRFVAKQDFVYDGKSFVAGDAFPWRDMGIAPHSLFILWQACRVECDFTAPTPTPEPTKVQHGTRKQR